jgi:hypothetical protein
MLHKFLIVGLLAIVFSIWWVVALDIQAGRRANQLQTRFRNPQTEVDLDEGLSEPPGPGGREEAEEYGWKLNYREALQEAKEADKPLMIVFRCVP